MRSWRVTKYDPALRDGAGAYLADDWISVADIGGTFGGRLLTREAYLRVERAYVDAAMAFHEAAGAPPLVVRGLEAYVPLVTTLDDALPALTEGEAPDAVRLPAVVRACLREELWCRLEAEDRTCAIHFGHDFYMYLVGTASPEGMWRVAERGGLFVEEFGSPYGE